MRRVAETAVPAPTLSRAGAFTPMSWSEIAPYFAFAAACYLVAPYLGLGSFTVDHRIAEVWPPGGVGFVLLSTVWWAGRRVIGLTLVGMAVVFFVTAALMWQDPLPALWMALVGTLQPFLMSWLYRRRLNHTGWAPETQQD